MSSSSQQPLLLSDDILLALYALLMATVRLDSGLHQQTDRQTDYFPNNCYTNVEVARISFTQTSAQLYIRSQPMQVGKLGGLTVVNE